MSWLTVHEISILLTILSVSILFLVMAIRYFLRKAKAEGSDSMLALRNGLLLGFALFVLFVIYYESVREKKVADKPDPAWCKKNPQKCRGPIPIKL